MRLIDAEKMPNDKFFNGMTDTEKAKVLQWFASAPTVDAVEVVRCRDCIYFHRYENKDFGYCSESGPDESVVIPDDDYCSCGEGK